MFLVFLYDVVNNSPAVLWEILGGGETADPVFPFCTKKNTVSRVMLRLKWTVQVLGQASFPTQERLARWGV